MSQHPPPHHGRRHAFIASSAVLLLALAGCGRAASEAETVSQPVDNSPASGELSVWVGGEEGEALPDFLADFEAQNPDLDVEVTQIPSDEFDAKLLTAISSGTVPDLVRLYSQTATGLLDTGGFAPVPDGLIEEDDFFESSYEQGVFDDTLYTIPWDAYATVLYYRSDLLRAAGLEVPTTWDEMKAFSAAAQQEDASWGIGMDVGYDVYNAQGLNEYIHQNGGSFTNADATEWTINSPENVEALEYWGSYFSEGLASPDGPAFLDTVPWFTTDKIASKDTGPWFSQWLKDAQGDQWVADNVATAPMPAGPEGSFSALGGGSLAVPTDAENPEAAWKLARYLTDPDVQVAWYQDFGSLPAVAAAWDRPEIADDPLLDAVHESLETAVDVPQVPEWEQVGTFIGQQMERVARGQATAQEALDEAQSHAEGVGIANG